MCVIEDYREIMCVYVCKLYVFKLNHSLLYVPSSRWPWSTVAFVSSFHLCVCSSETLTWRPLHQSLKYTQVKTTRICVSWIFAVFCEWIYIFWGFFTGLDETTIIPYIDPYIKSWRFPFVIILFRYFLSHDTIIVTKHMWWCLKAQIRSVVIYYFVCQKKPL